MTDREIDLPPPTLERTYYCNKCGHMGPVGESHPLPDGSGLCNYYAVSNGPYWNEEAVRAAILADRAARDKDAERYRWLQREMDMGRLESAHSDVFLAIASEDGNALDTAIDAAMEKDK